MNVQELYHNVFESGHEKVAAEASDLSPEQEDRLEKLAELEDALQGWSEEDLDKLAEEIVQEQEVEKVAADFIALGRFMARGFVDELQTLEKQAQEEAEEEEKPEEEEKKEDEKPKKKEEGSAIEKLVKTVEKKKQEEKE